MITSFSALGVDLPSIAVIVMHSFVRPVLWSNFSTNCLQYCLFCSFVILVISSFISYRAGDVASLDLRSSCALIFSNISVGTGSVLSQCRPEGMWCDAALRMMARKIFSLFLAVDRKPYFAHLFFYFSTVSVPVHLFQVDAGTMLYRVDSDANLQTTADG